MSYPHLGGHNPTEDLLVTFLGSLEIKLRKAKISASAVRVGKDQGLRWDMQNYLDMRPVLDQYKIDEAHAKVLEPEYLRLAAVQAVEAAYRQERALALRLLAGVLTSWRIVDALAEAFVQALGGKSKATKDSPSEELPYRFFVHATLSSGLDPKTVLTSIVNGWQEQFGELADLEEYGWMQGGIAAMSARDSSPDGLYLIVRAHSLAVVMSVKVWLANLGCGQISTPMMTEIELPKAASVDEQGEQQ